MNTHYLVKNLKGTSDNKCTCCGSWLKHWINNSHSTRTQCCVVGCSAKATDGAHVQIKDGRCGDEWYIVPFCKYHNNPHNEEEMFINRSVTLISARPDLCEAKK